MSDKSGCVQNQMIITTHRNHTDSNGFQFSSGSKYCSEAGPGDGMPMIEQQVLASEACVTGRPHLTLAPPAQSQHCRIGCLPCPRCCPADVAAAAQRVAARHARAARHPAGPPMACDAGVCRCGLAPARPGRATLAVVSGTAERLQRHPFRPIHTAPTGQGRKYAGIRGATVMRRRKQTV